MPDRTPPLPRAYRHFRVLRFDDIITERNVTNPEQIAKATERIQLADAFSRSRHAMT